MDKKKWVPAVGEVTGNPMDGDELLKQTKSNSLQKRIQRQENEEAAAYEARMAKLAKETAAAERAAEGPPEKPSASPFEVKGSVNLGTIDFQKQQEELKASIATIQQSANEQIKALNESNAHYRDEVHKIQITMVENTLKAQIDNLQKTIETGLVKPQDKSITAQIDDITKIAGVLGYTKPDAQSGLPAELQLRMLEMELAEKGRDREFELHKIESERNWTLALKKIEIEGTNRTAEIQSEREKRGMFISPFETIGAALAKGLADSNADAGGGVTRRVPKKASKGAAIETGVGESGVTECPQCGEPLAIAPTARSAVCSSCETTFAINRVEAKS